MKAEEILRTAADLVSGPRKEQHGDVGAVFGTAAELMGVFGNSSTDMTPREAIMFMIFLKIARIRHGAPNLDDYIDACGYLALAGQLESESKKITFITGVLLKEPQ